MSLRRGLLVHHLVLADAEQAFKAFLYNQDAGQTSAFAAPSLSCEPGCELEAGSAQNVFK